MMKLFPISWSLSFRVDGKIFPTMNTSILSVSSWNESFRIILLMFSTSSKEKIWGGNQIDMLVIEMFLMTKSNHSRPSLLNIYESRYRIAWQNNLYFCIPLLLPWCNKTRVFLYWRHDSCYLHQKMKWSLPTISLELILS